MPADYGILFFAACRQANGSLTNMISVAACTTSALSLSIPFSSMGRHASIPPLRSDCGSWTARMDRMPSKRASLRKFGAPLNLERDSKKRRQGCGWRIKDGCQGRARRLTRY